MKRFLIPLLAALGLPTAVNAETWIQATNFMFDKAKQGTMGYELCKTDNMCGFGYYVDAKSLVKRGDFVYFYLDVKTIDKYAIPKDRGFDGTGWIVDCKKKLMGTNLKKIRKPTGNTENELIEFVCK